MGSTGTGSFSDYSRKPSSAEEQNGGESGIDKCEIGFSTHLEEVTRCFYYSNYKTLPDIKSEVMVRFNGVRLVAENIKNEEIGYLPTKFNYIRYCIEEGYSYGGVISKASKKNPLSITISVTPMHE